jgi:hypothetical protein
MMPASPQQIIKLAAAAVPGSPLTPPDHDQPYRPSSVADPTLLPAARASQRHDLTTGYEQTAPYDAQPQGAVFVLLPELGIRQAQSEHNARSPSQVTVTYVPWLLLTSVSECLSAFLGAFARGISMRLL